MSCLTQFPLFSVNKLLTILLCVGEHTFNTCIWKNRYRIANPFSHDWEGGRPTCASHRYNLL